MTKSNDKSNNKTNSYFLIPLASYKEKKSNPNNQINKYVNKYNPKNNKNLQNDNSYYLKNSDIYIEHRKGIL